MILLLLLSPLLNILNYFNNKTPVTIKTSFPPTTTITNVTAITILSTSLFTPSPPRSESSAKLDLCSSHQPSRPQLDPLPSLSLPLTQVGANAHHTQGREAGWQGETARGRKGDRRAGKRWQERVKKVGGNEEWEGAGFRGEGKVWLGGRKERERNTYQ